MFSAMIYLILSFELNKISFEKERIFEKLFHAE